MRQERDHEPDPNYAEKRRAAKFQQGRWSLYVTFDPVAAQFSGGYGREFEEAWKFCMWVARNFGGLHFELPEILRWERYADTGRTHVEVSVDILDFQARALDWLTYHTIPVEVRLVRNGERGA